jgi:hypothetical protein
MPARLLPARRQLLKMGAAALAVIPVMVLCGNANAATNAAMRSALKYQDKPGPEGKVCSGCMQFVPGKTAKDPGGCKVMAGDTEISPNGYCTAWVKKT